MCGFINAECFLTEHRDINVFDVITLAYEEGLKDGKSEQLEKVVAELKSLLLSPDLVKEPVEEREREVVMNCSPKRS